VCVCVCAVSSNDKLPSLSLFFKPLLRSDLSVAPDDVKQCDVVEHLVSVVPGVQRSLAGVVVHHADVGVLVVERDVGVLVRGGVGVVGEVHLGAGQVGVGDVEGAADHEGLPRAALREPRVPALQDLQRARVHATHLRTQERPPVTESGKNKQSEWFKKNPIGG